MSENTPSHERMEISNPFIEKVSNFKSAHTVEDSDTGTKVDFKYVTVIGGENSQIQRISEGVGIQSLEDFKFVKDAEGRKVMKLGRSSLTNKADANASARLLSSDHGELVVEKDGSTKYKDLGSTNGTRALVPFGVTKLKENEDFKINKKQTFLLPLDYDENYTNRKYQLAVVVSNERETPEQTIEKAKVKSGVLREEIKSSFEEGQKVYPNKILKLTESAMSEAESENKGLYQKLHQEINTILQTTERQDWSEIEMVDGKRQVEVKHSGTYEIFARGVDFEKFKELVFKKSNHPETDQKLKVKLEDFVKSIEPDNNPKY